MKTIFKTLMIAALMVINVTNVVADCCKECGSGIQFMNPIPRADPSCATQTCYVTTCFDQQFETEGCGGTYACTDTFIDNCDTPRHCA